MFRLTIPLFRALEMFPFTLCNNLLVDLASMEDLAQSVYLEKIISVPVKTLQNNFEKRQLNNAEHLWLCKLCEGFLIESGPL